MECTFSGKVLEGSVMDRGRGEELDNYLRREKEEVEAEEADISCSHSSSGS